MLSDESFWLDSLTPRSVGVSRQKDLTQAHHRGDRAGQGTGAQVQPKSNLG
ncbi:MAG: hypothetical protein HC810_07325 [Acaryochloridaceae cyanobacterium RL_2_7]|nr:hypothetical protein [Acaryochloridaceae cyanobacterium RL_2_7]